jgi:hypothetical protein
MSENSTMTNEAPTMVKVAGMDDVADALAGTDGVAEALGGIGAAVVEAARHLGNGNACTNGVGAIEGFAMIVRDGGEKVAGSLDSIAAALDRIADAMEVSPTPPKEWT